VNYSIDTVQRLKQTLKKADHLFFLIGIDAFNDVAKWHQAEALFRECPFIVASRPGYSLADVANALPERLRPKAAVTKPFAKQPAKGDLVLGRDSSPFGRSAAEHLSHCHPGGGHGQAFAGQICRSGSRRVHQQDGTIPGSLMSELLL
jgi:hypothetical protein